jgi:hypothetical protein
MANTFCGLCIRLVMKVVTQRKSDTRTGAQNSALRVMKNVHFCSTKPVYITPVFSNFKEGKSVKQLLYGGQQYGLLA